MTEGSLEGRQYRSTRAVAGNALKIVGVLGSSETSVFRLLKGTHLLCSPFLWILASGGYLNVNGRLPL